MSALLSPRQAARILGVSESTVRRWCDDERIPAIRTHGKHRRIERSALLTFAREQGLSVGEANAATAGRGGRVAPSDELADRMFRAMVAADVSAVRKIAVELIEHGFEAALLCDEVIAVAMHRIGAEWETGRVQVYQEHAATQAAIGAVMAARAAVPEPSADAPLAMCAALAADPYSLGPAMSALVLQAEGFRSMLLGPDTPASQLALSIRRHEPRLVALSIGAVADPGQLVADVSAINHAAIVPDTAVVIGGRGLDRELRSQMTADFFGDTMKHLVGFARGLLV